MNQKDNPIVGMCKLHREERIGMWRSRFVHRWDKDGTRAWVSSDGNVKHGEWIDRTQVYQYHESRR
jgi:hypothetical protein